MDFALTANQEQVRDAVAKICARFDDAYWLKKDKSCFAVTEPNTGLNTTQLKTRAVRSGGKYIVNGQKVWISTAQVAEKILLLARTTPLEDVKTPTQGLSLFYTDFDRGRIAVHEIDKMGRKAVDSNELFIENFEVPL